MDHVQEPATFSTSQAASGCSPSKTRACHPRANATSVSPPPSSSARVYTVGARCTAGRCPTSARGCRASGARGISSTFRRSSRVIARRHRVRRRVLFGVVPLPAAQLGVDGGEIAADDGDGERDDENAAEHGEPPPSVAEERWREVARPHRRHRHHRPPRGVKDGLVRRLLAHAAARVGELPVRVSIEEHDGRCSGGQFTKADANFRSGAALAYRTRTPRCASTPGPARRHAALGVVQQRGEHHYRDDENEREDVERASPPSSTACARSETEFLETLIIFLTAYNPIRGARTALVTFETARGDIA